MLGLGSILGTGVFVSLAVAADVAGSSVILAAIVAAGIATCNGLSSAQLAANHPFSGGTYEYGYRYLNSHLGFVAGWMFLCAKSASAATAALGFSGYALNLFVEDGLVYQVPLAVIVVVLITVLVSGGMRRSATTNTTIVSITILSLVAFVIIGLKAGISMEHVSPLSFLNADSNSNATTLADFFEGCALLFVAYTGYGRIATLGEEVDHPRRTIPRAIIFTLVTSAALYVSVALVSIGTLGADDFGDTATGLAAPLEKVAAAMNVGWLPYLMAVGAITAMLGVLLNLVLGLSRVVLAMARRKDLPASLSVVHAVSNSPRRAVILVGLIVAGIALIGDVRTTWEFSAFTVLIYYSITNLSALRIERSNLLFPRIIPVIGLAACLFVAFWVSPPFWITGLGLIALGLLWHQIALSVRGRTND